jgi:hypothetical protein
MTVEWHSGSTPLLARGTVVAGYRVEAVLGHGGMGVVYEATQLSLDRTVALKLLAPHLSNDPVFRERFRREGLLQAALDHPHIVTIHEAGETEHGLFLAMRLIRGPRLKDLVLAGELDARRTLRLLSPIADALDTAHEAGLIHRDVKPQNILVAGRDHAYLSDFGLTKVPGEKSLTGTGQFVGTLDYVAPEQIVGEPAGVGSDVYSLAAVLFECLTGRVPFPRESEAAVLYGHLNDAPPKPTSIVGELPPGIDPVIERGLAKEPSERPGSAGALMDAAGAALGVDVPAVKPRTSDAEAGATETTRSLGRRSGRRRLSARLAGAVATCALLGLLLGALAGGGERARPVAVRAGAIAVEPPAGWHRLHSSPMPELGGPRALALAPRDAPRGAGLIVTPVRKPGPYLLPAALVADLRELPTFFDVVRLGDVQAQRYDHLRSRGTRRVATVYAVPHSGGVAALGCVAPNGGAHAFMRSCEQVAATLSLDGVTPRTLRPSSRYASRLTAAMNDLNLLRRVARIRLLRDSVQQVAAARMLARAFGRYADAMRALQPPPPVARAHADMIAAAARAHGAYRKMARAVAAQDGAGYAASVKAAYGGEVALQRAFEALRPLGYEVR